MNRKPVIMMMLALTLAVAGWFLFQQSKNDIMITPAELQDRIAEDSTIVLLDVRTPAEWESTTGHLPGALLIPVQELADRVGDLEAHRERPVIVYCRTQNRSIHAAAFLKSRGFNATAMAGGIARWKSEGRPVVHESSKGA